MTTEVSPGVFEHGPAGVPAVFRRITRLAFLLRFTDAEAIALDIASAGNGAPAAAVRRRQKKLESSAVVDLDDPRVRAEVQAMEGGGSGLSAGRASAILDSVVLSSERP